MNLKREKGITLIALVITIIVLLILAGVTINMVLGDDGIIQNAQKAKEDYSNASDDATKKQILLALKTQYLKEGNLTEEKIERIVKATYPNATVDEVVGKEGQFEVKINGKTYIIIDATGKEIPTEGGNDEPTVETITFTIDGKACTAAVGMTKKEWILSEYNTMWGILWEESYYYTYNDYPQLVSLDGANFIGLYYMSPEYRFYCL